MARIVALALSVALFALAAGAKAAGEERPERKDCVVRARLDGVVSSGSANYLADAVERAERSCSAALLVIDTPGGQLDATRTIVSALLGAEVPVLTYVAPSGARAGSAGVFITMAGHVAAMAPGSNIGAAHPVVGLGKDPEEQGEHMGRKIENDVAAFARAIAEQRGRNVDWAEKAVRESVSVTATEAAELGVVDLIAPSEEALLDRVDGRAVQVGGEEVVLQTAGAEVRDHEMTLRQKALSVLGDPNLAYLLLMIGLLGLVLEIASPGLIIPGAVGAFALILGAIGMNVLPVNLGAVVLVVAGVGLLIAEIYVTSYGLLAAGGTAAIITGSLLLVDRDSERFFADASVSVSWGAILPLAAVLAGAAGAIAWQASRTQRRRSPTGAEGIVGNPGRALTDVDRGGGTVLVAGERWRASSPDPLPAGTSVRVVGVDGLELQVRRQSDKGEES